jgi:hypothetical protein
MFRGQLMRERGGSTTVMAGALQKGSEAAFKNVPHQHSPKYLTAKRVASNGDITPHAHQLIVKELFVSCLYFILSNNAPTIRFEQSITPQAPTAEGVI